VMSQAVGIHPIVVLISVIIGLKVAGIAGAIFALPFAAVIASFFHYFVGSRANQPRDVTSRAAKRVGEREGRRVRVPAAPAVVVAESTAAEDTPDPEPTPKSTTQPKPAEPTA
jgi:hypothetical protein